jgi:hypothetical protein
MIGSEQSLSSLRREEAVRDVAVSATETVDRDAVKVDLGEGEETAARRTSSRGVGRLEEVRE